jgi:hypothetical protein
MSEIVPKNQKSPSKTAKTAILGGVSLEIKEIVFLCKKQLITTKE